ncbi:NAD(P)-binding protein [Xylariaceae sp. FL1272]|nr:NAD(P)-binding protein [Xylariaceae sp. FL1272]
MPVTFDITPEKEASKWQFLYRQLFVYPPVVSRSTVDLTGKTAIITGASGGIGLECASQFLGLGLTKLILAVRNTAKTEALIESLTAGLHPKPTLEVWPLDYLSYDSITAFTERAERLDHIDLVVLNAGIYRTTINIIQSTGHEENVQVNYLSTVFLLVQLLNLIKAKSRGSVPGRLTVVSSDVAAWYDMKEKNEDPLLPAFDRDDPKFHHHQRYGTSKLLTQIFITELAKRVPPSVAVVDCVNPGFCHSSGLTRDADGTFLGLIAGIIVRLIGRSPSEGARSVVDATVRHGEAAHGQYLEDGKLTPHVQSPLSW